MLLFLLLFKGCARQSVQVTPPYAQENNVISDNEARVTPDPDTLRHADTASETLSQAQGDVQEASDDVQEAPGDTQEVIADVQDTASHSVPDTLRHADTASETLSQAQGDVQEAQGDVQETQDDVPEVIADVQKTKTVLALKTNLLYDLALAPNIELEFPFAKDRFSIMAEWWAPWWTARSNTWAYQLLYAGVEARVWLGNREKLPSLSGHFFGIYGGGGIFDFERNNIGYQSQFYYTAGLTYGYSFPIHQNLRIETSVSAGYLNADYQKYEAMEDGRFLVWQNDGRFSWLGPTKLKVSLVWTIFNNNRRNK